MNKLRNSIIFVLFFAAASCDHTAGHGPGNGTRGSNTGMGGANVDPIDGVGGETDPGTGGTTDPGTGGVTDPGTGGTVDPGTGGTGGSSEPGTGGTVDPGTGGTTDPGTGGTVDPGTGGTVDPGTGGSTGTGGAGGFDGGSDGVNCVYTLGFYKNHTDVWPVQTLFLGQVEYSQAQLIDILNAPATMNALTQLARQLIAAKLNVAGGANGGVATATMDAADALIGSQIAPPVGDGTLSQEDASGLIVDLTAFNQGTNEIPHCI